MKKLFSLNNTALSIGLAILAPYFYFWSGTWAMYTTDALVVSICAILLLACFSFFAGTLIKSMWGRIFPAVNARLKENLANICYTIVCFSVLALLFKSLYPGGVNKYLVFAIIVVVGSFSVSFFKLHKLLNFLLIILLIIMSLKFAHSLMADTSDNLMLSDKSNLKESVTLNKKPNIYLFILESYQNLEILENVYSMDVSVLRNFLSTNNFTYYENTYGNHPFTLMSLCDLFALQDYEQVNSGSMDISVAARFMVGGDNKNVIFKTFKENGYFVESLWLQNQSYYVLQQGPNLDKVDTAYNSDLGRLLQPAIMINNNVYKLVYKLLNTKNKTSLSAAVTASIKSRPANMPYFLTIKTGADHSPTDYSWRPGADWKDTGIYQNLMKNSLDELLPVVSDIIDIDPDAMIILIGDHGARHLRGFIPKRLATDNKIDVLCAEHGVSRKDHAQDAFGVLLAIRMPGETQDISRGYQMSHRNLFLHIFSAINQDASLLNNRELSISIEDNMTMVREGEVLQRWLSD